MPDDVMPIGEDGQFVRLVDLIWIEDENRRRILTPDGKLLFDSHPVPKSVPTIQRPIVEVGHVCEFDINRFGHCHSNSQLSGVRGAVCELARELKRPLRIIDTFGWSGEIALALCRIESSDIVTIVDDLTGTDRSVTPWGNRTEHCDMLFENLGPLLETRIQYSPCNPVALPDGLTDEFDLVFIDTVADNGRIHDLIDAWLPRLSDDGMFIGVSTRFKEVTKAICQLISGKTQVDPVCLLPKRMLEEWHSLQEVDVA